MFPQYRRYKNQKSVFKIISENEFIEIQQVGKNFFMHTVKAENYPEKVYINDMLNCYEGRWEIITEDEYNHFTSSIKYT
jgi:uncharacterized pyridoxamine 5'-phosphate oxidase family protein